MDKNIEKVRKRIKSRKKSIRHHEREPMTALDLLHPIISSDEDRHHIEQQLYQFNKPPKKLKRNISRVNVTLYKLIGAVSLFFITLIVMRSNLVMVEERWVYKAFQEEFPFATVYDWYVTNLGAPVAFMPEQSFRVSTDNEIFSSPVIGEVVESFKANGVGIKISPSETTQVSAVNRGIVIFAGNDKETLKTVIIQHPDRSLSTYGYLSTIDVHLYQFVDANEIIGTFQPREDSETVFFAIEKENEFIDPIKVIRLD